MKKVVICLLLFVLTQILFSEVRVITESVDRMVIQVTNDSYKLVNAGRFIAIEAATLRRSELKGAPDLPFERLNIALPPRGDIHISELERETINIDLSKPIVPIPEIVENSSTHEYRYRIDETLYDKRFDLIGKRNKTRYRTFEYIPVELNLFQYNASANRLTITTNLKLEISIKGNKNYRSDINDKFHYIYEDLFLNYRTAKYWQWIEEKRFDKMPFAKSQFWYNCKVYNTGFYKIYDDQLSSLPDFLDPNTLRLFTMFKTKNEKDQSFELVEVPIFIANENRNELEPGDAIFFEHVIREAELPEYCDYHVYWLTFGGTFDGHPRRIADLEDFETAREVSDFSPQTYDFTRPRNAPDGIVIYPDEATFKDQAERYSTIHPEHVFLLKSQEEIFAEFSGGNPDPLAIREYLHEQFITYPDTLEYVILMGAGTSEWNNTSPKNKIIFQPNSDDELVDFDNDYIADLIIGRLPATNVDDLESLLDRIERYINEPTSGFWKDIMMIIADDENKDGGYEGYGSSGLNHGRLAQETTELIDDNVLTEKIMGFNYDFDEFQNKPGARNAMIEAVNEGRLIWYYIGHGNEDVLGDEDYFRGSLHMNMLQNMDYLPLFCAASCSVGKFDDPGIDCIAEKLLFYENGGSIASIAATRSCDGSSNTTLMKKFFKNILNERNNIGRGLLDAKINSGAGYLNSFLYNILGDPILSVTPPEKVGNISALADTLFARETVSFSGYFGDQHQLEGDGVTHIFEPEKELTYVNTNYTLNDTFFTVDYTQEGNRMFHGVIELTAGNYDAEFIVPDEVNDGNSGKILSYKFDEINSKDYINAKLSLSFSSEQVGSANTIPPIVNVFLDSKGFRSGDYVSSDPLLIAEIEDDNGINILGNAGHGILLLLDDAQEPLDITSGFVYNEGSSTAGELSWQLENLFEGSHQLQLIVYDNQNNYTIAETDFITKTSTKVSIEKLLPYPHPMKDEGHFTFIITEDADVKISIYTISGKKLRVLEAYGLTAGFNKVFWDCRDDVGDEIANGNYFYKIQANQLENNKKSEKIGKLIILK